MTIQSVYALATPYYYYNPIYGQSTVYATARSTSIAWSSTYSRVGQLKSGSYFNCWRLFWSFDTSFLGASATLIRAYITATVSTDNSSPDFAVEIMKADWANDLNSQREANFDLALSATKDVTWRNTSGIATNTPYQSPDLDLAYIKKTGNTRYAVVSDRDIAATEPGANTNEWIQLWKGDYTTTSYRPTLTIEYSTAQPRVSVAMIG